MRVSSLLLGAIVLIGVIAGCIVVVTQPWVQAIKSQPPQVDAKRLEAHVKYLSVDLYPRSHDQLLNIELAAEYLFNELKASGATMTMQDVVVQGTKYKNVVARY